MRQPAGHSSKARLNSEDRWLQHSGGIACAECAAMTGMTKAAGPNSLRYSIIETDMGPLISESRVSVFDVMDAHDAGDSQYEIGLTFNLSPL
jgi:hypothetical protein